jgi:hypothetical protein
MSGYVALRLSVAGAGCRLVCHWLRISSLRITGSLVMPELGCGGTIVPRPAIPALERESASGSYQCRLN